MHLSLPAMLALCGIAACSPDFQTSSGADYIASRGGVIDPEIRAAAAVEGELRFPARIGLVRLVNGEIELFPQAEAEALAPLTDGTPDLGEFVPLAPLLGTMISTDRNAGLLERVQLIAARQHLDYALVFSFDTSESSVQAVFLDVRSGYPYATAQAVTRGRPVGWRADPARINRRTLDLIEELTPQLSQMLDGLAEISAS